jgi:phenylacetate-CoA ligase
VSVDHPPSNASLAAESAHRQNANGPPLTPSDLLQVKSGIAGLVWPPVAKAASAQLLALVQWLDRSQWLDPASIQAGQARQLALLLKHFEEQSEWFLGRLQGQGLTARALGQSAQAFAQLPVLTRRELQLAGPDFHSRIVPEAHRPLARKQTSGSTGETVLVYRSALNQLFWLATTVREHLWHQRDPRGRLALVRRSVSQPTDWPDWGAPVASLFDTGPSFGMPITTDTQALIEWLLRVQPNYLLIFPNVLRDLLDKLPVGQTLPGLAQIRTISETLSADLRVRTQDRLGVTIADTYSCEEAGVIALQCPHSGPDTARYHTMAEGLMVEVLRASGDACDVGEVGRVVVTDLLNFASPVIRYDIGDYAEQGPVCTCGRGLPTLKRVMGRERNMVKLPDGRSYWPQTGFREFASVADIAQYQFVQKSLTLIEVRLVVNGPALMPDTEAALAEIISAALKHRFNYQFVYFADRLPKPASGKFEEYVCEC